MFTTLMERFADMHEAPAVVEPSGTTTYTELVQSIEAWTASLSAAGVGLGSVVSLEATHSANSAAAMLALVGLGAVCVPMTRLPETRRREFADLAQVELRILAESVPADREPVLPPDREPVLLRTAVSAEHDLYRVLREGEHPGLVLFSSGTTGRSKASVLDFEKVLRRYTVRRPARRILSFLNLDHIGGVNTLLHTLSQGGVVVTIADRTPDAVFAAVAEHAVEVLPTTPTFLTMTLISGAHRRYDVSSLAVVTYGTEPMPQQTLDRMARELPHVRMKQTYGLSELGILATQSRSDDSLWVKLGGSDFDHKVVDGVLWVRSEMAMLGYLNAPSPFDDDGYFDTQDAVEVDGEYLRILGRTSELINVAGEKVYPNEVESVLLEMDNVADVTVSGIDSRVTGQLVAATMRLVEPEEPGALRTRLDLFCRNRLEPYKVPAKVTITQDPQHSDRFKKLR